MSIYDTDKIDAIGVDNNTGHLALFLIDGNDWEDEDHHLLLLQGKINLYLSYIESGQIMENYPDAADRAIEIVIHFQYEPLQKGIQFLKQVKNIIQDAGYLFDYHIHS